jgi:hypothetical protein
MKLASVTLKNTYRLGLPAWGSGIALHGDTTLPSRPIPGRAVAVAASTWRRVMYLVEKDFIADGHCRISGRFPALGLRHRHRDRAERFGRVKCK